MEVTVSEPCDVITHQGMLTLLQCVKSMTVAYVTLHPKSMSLGDHFGFWAANGPRWPLTKCQDDFFTS